MSHDQLFHDTLKAIAVGDGERAQRLNRSIPEERREGFHVFATALFASAISEHFAADRSPEAIAVFVDDMCRDFAAADPPLKPEVIEALVRALFGEGHLMDQISPPDQMRVQFLAIREIVDSNPRFRAALDDHLTEAARVTGQRG